MPLNYKTKRYLLIGSDYNLNINNGLLEAQQSKRKQSIDRVDWAVQFIKDTEGQHAKITAVKVSEISGLSRAVLYKAHLRKIWDKKATDKPHFTTNSSSLHRDLKEYQRKISHLESLSEKQERQMAKYQKELEKEKLRAKVYREDYEELKERHQKLLHHNLRLLRKLHVHGINTNNLDELLEEFDDVNKKANV